MHPMLDRTTACVLVIDVQERLAPAMAEFARVEKYCRALVVGGRELGLPVLASEQYPRGLGATIASVREALPRPAIPKMHFSCTNEPAIVAALAEAGRKQVIVAGMEAHVCVLQTVRDLVALGYRPFVCADAVASRTEENRRIALEQMRDMGAVVTSAETVLFDLLHVSGTPEFKVVSALIK
ncbi:MAG TPA: hydrolase [Anaeromyxobacteraceae bacterium]|nr:hydrolase [Anaeromyxobacteraceae bacterium]